MWCEDAWVAPMVKRLPLAQVMIPGPGMVPCVSDSAQCSLLRPLPLLFLSLALTLSLSGK